MYTRREVLAALAASGSAVATNAAVAAKHTASFTMIATGLQAPEGPKTLPDGSVMICEMARGTLSRVRPGGPVSVIADLGGSPNGSALGPDGAAYVVNSGGMTFKRDGELWLPDPPPKLRSGGSLQRVALDTGSVTTLYSAAKGHPIHSPNDIVFDRRGGCWFTDPGVPHRTDDGSGAVFWAQADGSEIRQVWELPSPNGIVLSPDGHTLYVALTGPRQIVACPITAMGTLAVDEVGRPQSRTVITMSDTKSLLDSMAVEADGTLVVGTLFTGCLSLVRPDGTLRDQLYFPERFVTNLAFGGRDLRTAYVTLTTTGRLVATHWPRPGLRLAY